MKHETGSYTASKDQALKRSATQNTAKVQREKHKSLCLSDQQWSMKLEVSQTHNSQESYSKAVNTTGQTNQHTGREKELRMKGLSPATSFYRDPGNQSESEIT